MQHIITNNIEVLAKHSRVPWSSGELTSSFAQAVGLCMRRAGDIVWMWAMDDAAILHLSTKPNKMQEILTYVRTKGKINIEGFLDIAVRIALHAVKNSHTQDMAHALLYAIAKHPYTTVPTLQQAAAYLKTLPSYGDTAAHGARSCDLYADGLKKSVVGTMPLFTV